jgi:hypothetical protein
MKNIIALAVIGIASQTIVAFAGPEEKAPVMPPPTPPPCPSFFRPNEFDIGAFGTWAPWTGISGQGSPRGWGGGLDLEYWFPWKYAGVRFEGTGMSVHGGGFTTTVHPFPGLGLPGRTVNVPSWSTGAGTITAQAALRLPLDDFWCGVHLAPYVFGGFGGLFVGSSGGRTFSETVTVTGPVTVTNANGTVTTVVPAGQTAQRTFTGKRLNAIRNNVGTDRVLGLIGGGLEYRFTPNIAIFSEASYNIVNGASNNFVQFNFIGLKYAF